MNTQLSKSLKKLNLSGLEQTLDVRLHEAVSNKLTHQEFLELILQDELNIRQQRMISRKLKAACFHELRTIEDFDFGFNKAINSRLIHDLATCQFMRERRDVLLIGPPGVGKSHLAQALGYQAIKAGYHVYYRSVFDLVRDLLEEETLGTKTMSKYLRPELLIIDDMGIKQLPKRSGEFLFEIIMRRYETRSTIMTSNRPIEEWGKLLTDVPSATAILDRFLHHAEIINITGRSYRLKDRTNVKNRIDNVQNH